MNFATPPFSVSHRKLASVLEAARHLKPGLETGERMGHWIAVTAVAPVVKWAGDIFGASEF
jgi:hypothetical protein